MRIVIVGPGALGSLLAARLFLLRERTVGADNDILSLHLLDYRPERARILQAQGLLLEEGDRSILCAPEISFIPDICRTSDVIFFCVKSPSVVSALGRITPHLSDRSLLLAMQNGIGHLDAIIHSGSPAGVGITSEGATLVRPGHVRHGGHGITRLGLLTEHAGQAERTLLETADLLNRAGMKTAVTEHPLQHIWAKLFVNVGINALTAIHGCRNGELLNLPSALDKLKLAVREAEIVARAKGVAVDGDPVETTIGVCRTTAHNMSSMLQDVLRKRITEIDAINGAIVVEGGKLGIPTPVNAELVTMVKEVEASYAGA